MTWPWKIENDRSWRSPPLHPTVFSAEVHVWRALLDQPASIVQRLEQTLTDDERGRAGRYRFQSDRTRFIVARGVLRAILGRYLGIEPGQLRFCYNTCGKPALACGGDDLYFNLSHSHHIALYAITRGRNVGIDVEHIRPATVNEGIAERFFSPQEMAALRALPSHLQTRAFFACWTRKEAYIKARGQGLALPLDQFDVSLAPGEPAALLRTRGDEQEALRWSLEDLDVGEGVVAALAVEGHSWQLKCWHLKPSLVT